MTERSRQTANVTCCSRATPLPRPSSSPSHGASSLRWIASCFAVLILSVSCSRAPETPGERFARVMKGLAENCAKMDIAPNNTACDILKLEPADPLATPEGRFAHSIEIPDPVPEDSGYRPGMTSEEYFNHLCEHEAGEFIYKTVDNVEGLYQMRPRKRASDDELSHLYAMEDPYGYTNWEARSPQTLFINPPWSNYVYLEAPLPSTVQSIASGAKFRRFSGYVLDKKPMTEKHVETLESSYGFTWRGISRPHDRELGIAGGELIVLDLRTNEVLGVRRGYIRSPVMKNNRTGIWWVNGTTCPEYGEASKRNKDVDYTYSFVRKVLRPSSDNAK